MEETELKRNGKTVRSFGGWFSLNCLLELYEPGALATTIEGLGVMVIDRYGRRAQADPAGQDDYSRCKALDLLAERQAEIENPGPDFPSWESDRYEVEPHPLDRFGWTADNLPSFEKVEGLVSAKAQVPWSERPWKAFESEYRQLRSFKKCGALHRVSGERYRTVFRKKQKQQN
jgi:hypothetical protein